MLKLHGNNDDKNNRLRNILKLCLALAPPKRNNRQMPSPFDNVEPPLTKVGQLKSLSPSEVVGFSSLLLVKKIADKTAKNGAPYLVVVFGDKTGEFAVTVFSDTPFFQLFKTDAPEGSVVIFTGTTAYYQERFSPKVVDIRRLSGEEQKNYPVHELIDASQENPIEMWEELQKYIGKIKNEKLRATVNRALEDIGDSFKTHPAGRAMHHAYRHGLLEHTLHVCRVADALLPLYKEVNEDLTRAGTALHDIGKTVELTYDMTTKYSRLGTLHGHVVIGYRMARAAALKEGLDAELLERLEHIILSHQGELQFGAPVKAATPEAVFVSLIDNLDAKMGAMQNALRSGGENDEFSEMVPALGAKILLKPIAQ
jgi:3'-5' exoribonuclease